MSGDQSRLSTVKATMQAAIAGIHAAENNQEDCARKMRGGIIWDDGDFKTLGLDAHCLPLEVDQSNFYEPWCHCLVIDIIVEYYKLHDNEGVVI